jgi:protein kinase A
VLTDGDGYVRIGDFGLSRVLSDGVAHSVCGTPEYEAPEMLLEHPYGPPVDWWALGVMAYFIMVGTVRSLF